MEQELALVISILLTSVHLFICALSWIVPTGFTLLWSLNTIVSTMELNWISTLFSFLSTKRWCGRFLIHVNLIFVQRHRDNGYDFSQHLDTAGFLYFVSPAIWKLMRRQYDVHVHESKTCFNIDKGYKKKKDVQRYLTTFTSYSCYRYKLHIIYN